MDSEVREYSMVKKGKPTHQEALDMADANIDAWPDWMKAGLQTAPKKPSLCERCTETDSCRQNFGWKPIGQDESCQRFERTGKSSKVTK